MDDDVVGVWKALADGTRRGILDMLHERAMTTGEIAAAFPTSRIAVMKHLGVLSAANIVVSEKRGRQRWHHLNFVPLRLIYERWLDPERGRWAEALVGLKRQIEGRKGMARPDAASGGFAIDVVEEITIAAAADVVFAAIVDDPGAWWGRPFLDARAEALTLEARVCGAFVERWAGDGGALLAQVTRIEPGRQLELTGRLHFDVVFGVVDFRLMPAGTDTVLRFSHKAIGSLDRDVAAKVGEAWRDLLGVRLKAFVETGKRKGLDDRT